MKITEEQKEKLASIYAKGKSSYEVFRENHKKDFIAGFNKALELIEIIEKIDSVPNCTCNNSLDYSNCSKKCKRSILEEFDL